MGRSAWILLDTETTGITAPIYVVELAARRPLALTPEGPSFRRMLNHDADVPLEASRVNGYNQQVLERDGEPPPQRYGALGQER